MSVAVAAGARVVCAHYPGHGVCPHEARHRGGAALVHLLLLQQKLKQSIVHNANAISIQSKTSVTVREETARPSTAPLTTSPAWCL